MSTSIVRIDGHSIRIPPYLNPQDPQGLIPWADFSYNPHTGCKRECDYCYMIQQRNRYGMSHDPAFHPNRLSAPKNLAPHPSRRWRIFVCSTGEIGGPWVPQEWVEAIVRAIRESPEHDFMLLTKYPENLVDINWPKNAWVGATITNQADAEDRLVWVKQFRSAIKYVSFEPLHGPVFELLDGLQWVIIGAQTKPDLQPEWWWASTIMKHAEVAGAKVFLKNNLDLPNGQKRVQEWPT